MNDRRDELISLKRDKPLEIDKKDKPKDTVRESAMTILGSESPDLQLTL